MATPPTELAARIEAHAHPAWLYRYPVFLRIIFGWYRLLYQRTWATQCALRRELSALPPGAVVFDAGCGEGLFLFRTARAFPTLQFIGGDLRTANLRLATAYLARTGLKNVELQQADLLDPATLPTAHLIYSVGVLHLLADDAAALRHLRAACAPGGTLLLYTPVHRRRVLPWFEGWYRRFANYEATHAQRRYTPQRLRRVFAAAGWTITDERYTNGTLGIIGYELYTGSFLLLSAGRGWQRLAGGLLLVLTLPLVLLLNALDYVRRPARGNGVLLTARILSAE